MAIEPNADTRRRLLQIVKTEAAADDLVEGARTLLVTERIIGSLGQNRFPDTGALLVLVFTNGTPGPETHWLSGSENLKALLPAVRSATYSVRFPDASPARLAVPGVLGCPPVQSTCGLMIGEPIPLPPSMRAPK